MHYLFIAGQGSTCPAMKSSYLIFNHSSSAAFSPIFSHCSGVCLRQIDKITGSRLLPLPIHRTGRVFR